MVEMTLEASTLITRSVRRTYGYERMYLKAL